MLLEPVLLADEVAGDPAPVGDRSMLPQVNPLPHPEEQSAAFHAEGHGLGGECRTDVGRHVVVALVVVEVAGAVALAILRTEAILWDHGIHPCRQIAQHPGVSVLVDRQACAGVHARQVQHAQVDAGGCDPAVELLVEADEALPMRGDLQLVEGLLHGDGAAGPSIVAVGSLK
jgi:hypothetical protein